MQRLTVPEPGRTAEETVRPRVLPTGDSSAGLPCVGLGRNNVYFQRGLNQESEKLYVASCNITEMTIENVALRKYPIYSSFKPVSPIIQY